MTKRTWTSGEDSRLFAAEVREAMRLGVPLLLAHEMPGIGQESRDPVDFGAFFKCAEGTTPQELLDHGIYSKIALALKGGEWREVSMSMVANAIAKATGEHNEVVEFAKSSDADKDHRPHAEQPPVDVSERAPVEAAPSPGDTSVAAEEKIRSLQQELQRMKDENELLKKQLLSEFAI